MPSAAQCLPISLTPPTTRSWWCAAAAAALCACPAAAGSTKARGACEGQGKGRARGQPGRRSLCCDHLPHAPPHTVPRTPRSAPLQAGRRAWWPFPSTLTITRWLVGVGVGVPGRARLLPAGQPATGGVQSPPPSAPPQHTPTCPATPQVETLEKVCAPLGAASSGGRGDSASDAAPRAFAPTLKYRLPSDPGVTCDLVDDEDVAVRGWRRGERDREGMGRRWGRAAPGLATEHGMAVPPPARAGPTRG